jgi:outer membrane immunogenic protein
MKRFLLAGAAILAAVAGVQAADMALRGAPPYQPPQGFSWSGLYIGGEGGYGFSAVQLGAAGSNIFGVTDPGSIGPNASGGVGGLTLAFRYQPVGTGWVLGVKGAFDIMGINSQANQNPGASLASLLTTGMTPPAGSTSIPWDSRIGFELGYALTPNFLLFVDGGAAFGEIKLNATAVDMASVTITNPTGIVQANTGNTHVGWWAGLGAKYAINPNVVLGAEWVYTDLGTHGLTFQGGPASTAVFNVSDHAAYNKVLGTLEFKF